MTRAYDAQPVRKNRSLCPLHNGGSRSSPVMRGADSSPSLTVKTIRALPNRRRRKDQMMPKSDTIDAILKLNPTVNPAFLAEFSNQELNEYLQRLRQLPRRPWPIEKVYPTTTPLVAAVATGQTG